MDKILNNMFKNTFIRPDSIIIKGSDGLTLEYFLTITILPTDYRGTKAYLIDILKKRYSLEKIGSFTALSTNSIQDNIKLAYCIVKTCEEYSELVIENNIKKLKYIKNKYEEKFEEEFTDVCGYDGQVIPGTLKCTNDYALYNTSVSALLGKYFGHDIVVKIKAKDGKIVIERVK